MSNQHKHPLIDAYLSRLGIFFAGLAVGAAAEGHFDHAAVPGFLVITAIFVAWFRNRGYIEFP